MAKIIIASPAKFEAGFFMVINFIENMEEKFELAQNLEQLKWGFPKPTIVVESASAAAFKGIEEKQYYRRMYLMCGKDDIYVVNKKYPIDSDYSAYLKNVLGVELPTFLELEFPSPQSSLTTSMIADHYHNGNGKENTYDLIDLFIASGCKLQFFEVTQDEVEFANHFGNPTYSKNLSNYFNIGTKPGFKSFCFENNIPTPSGSVCHDIDELLTVASEIGPELIIKASEGTGGEDFGSNVSIHVPEDLNGKNLKTIIEKKLLLLKPNTFPIIVEKKLQLPEGSLHFFINESGQIIFEPTVFNQIAKNYSYVGGFYPNHLPQEVVTLANIIAQENIIPALIEIGATGFHCLDFLYDEKTNLIFFIEDNTRPGALDIVDHFVKNVISANNLGYQYSWFHLLVPLSELGITGGVSFGELEKIIKDPMIPGQNFVLISSPDILPFGFSLLLTGISCGKDASIQQAKTIHQLAVNKLKNYYGKKLEGGDSYDY